LNPITASRCFSFSPHSVNPSVGRFALLLHLGLLLPAP
jgi:hypothetical protein